MTEDIDENKDECKVNPPLTLGDQLRKHPEYVRSFNLAWDEAYEEACQKYSYPPHSKRGKK